MVLELCIGCCLIDLTELARRNDCLRVDLLTLLPRVSGVGGRGMTLLIERDFPLVPKACLREDNCLELTVASVAVTAAVVVVAEEVAAVVLCLDWTGCEVVEVAAVVDGPSLPGTADVDRAGFRLALGRRSARKKLTYFDSRCV